MNLPKAYRIICNKIGQLIGINGIIPLHMTNMPIKWIRERETMIIGLAVKCFFN